MQKSERDERLMRRIENEVDEWLEYYTKSKSESPIGCTWEGDKFCLWCRKTAKLIRRIPAQESFKMYADGTLRELVETEKAIALLLRQ